MTFGAVFPRVMRPPFGPGLTAAGGGFSPIDITGCDLWLNAEALALSDGASVTTWPDSSGAGHNADGTGHAPVFKTGILNGLPVVRFDGTSQYLRATLTSGAAKTVFAVATLNSGDTSQGLFGFSNNAIRGFYITNQFRHQGDDYVTESVSLPIAFRVFSLSVGAATTQAWKNGASLGTAAGNATAESTLDVGRLYGSGIYFLKGDIAEFIVYTSALGTTDRQAVEAYLLARYALP